MTLYISNGTFITMNDANPVVYNGHMVVTHDRITYLDTAAPNLSLIDGADVLDGSKLVFMPGLINTHAHSAMSLLRGYSDDEALQVWLEQKMWPMEGRYSDADARAGNELAIAEMLKSGTTTFVDMYDRMHIAAQAAIDSGIRAVLTRGVIGLCPPDEQVRKLEEAKQFARDYNGAADGRIRTMLSPHAPYTCPPDYIERIVEAAHELGLPLHTHMSETAHEVQMNVDAYGLRPVEHLEKLGFFTRPALVAHAVHLTDYELELLAEYQVSVAHNPASNLKLASGVARIPAMLKKGIAVGLGTDSAASNNNLDVFDEMRLAALLHKGVSLDPTAVPAFAALKLATSDGARAIWLADSIGKLEVGMKADFIAVNGDQPHCYPRTDWISHLVYAVNGRDVVHVWVDGKQLVRNRDLLTLDEERVKAEADLAYRRLLHG